MSSVIINPYAYGGGVLSSITVFGTATADNTATIACPASIVAGDLIVLQDLSTGGTTQAAEVLPTGFTTLASQSLASLHRMIVSWKKADGTEGGTSITGMVAGGFGRVAKVMYVFRGNVAATTITAVDPGAEATTGNPAAQTVTSATGPAPLVVCGFYGATSLVDPRTFTVGGSAAKDGETNLFSNGAADADAWTAYKIYNSSPADVVIDMDDEGDNLLQSCYFTTA